MTTTRTISLLWQQAQQRSLVLLWLCGLALVLLVPPEQRALTLAAALAGTVLLHNARLRRQLDDERMRGTELLQLARDAMISLAPDGRIQHWNRAAEVLFGCSENEARGRVLEELIVPPMTRDTLRPLLSRVLAGERVEAFDCRLQRLDGRLLDVCLTPQYSGLGVGTRKGVLLTVQDTGPQLAAAARLATLSASLEQQTAACPRYAATSRTQRIMLENAECALVATDAEGIISLFNAAAETLFGYQAMHLVGKASPLILLDGAASQPPGVVPDLAAWTGSNRDGESRECVCVCANGSRIPVQLTVKPLRDGTGAILAWLATVTDLSARQEEARDKRMLLDILQRSPDFIGVADMEGRFKYHNHGALAALGLPPDTDPGSLNPCAIFSEWGMQRLLAQALPTVLSEGVWRGDNALQHRDGHEIPVSQVLVLHRNAAGEPEFLSTIVRDMSEYKRRELELAEAREQAEAANRAKSLFLASMSHEIRTPIHAMLGLLHLLRGSTSSPLQLDYIARTSTAARVLLGNLEDVLDFSRVEAGHLALDVHPFDMETVLQALAVIMGSSVGDKPVELLFDIDPTLPPRLLGDALRLQQVLINLAGNAIKFTARGEVLVSVRVEDLHADAVSLRFSVFDSGIGIPAERCATIFDGYEQGEPFMARQYGGTGLGLSISQRLVRLMGGELAVASEAGRGSVFHFSLRLQRADDEPPPAPPPRHVLIVHANQAARRVLGDMMVGLDWYVASVADLSAAQALFRGNAFQLVLIDAPLLQASPTDFRLAAGGGAGQATVLVLGDNQCQQELEQLLAEQRVARYGFLEKPFTAAMLLDVVERSAEPARPPSESGQALAGLNVLLVEDNPLNQQVARELLMHEGASIELVSNGRAGVEAVQRAERPFDLVLMDIHMPVMDGYDAARAIRCMGVHDLPIIAMTADVTATDRAACLAAGMNDHVGKPFELATLVSLIHRHVRRRQQEGTAPATPASVGNWFDVETALRCYGSGGVYPRILQRFVNDAQAMADTLLQLLGEGRAEEALELLHTLKGIAATVSAIPLVSSASWLERALSEGEQTALLPDKLEELRHVLDRTVAAAADVAAALGSPFPDPGGEQAGLRQGLQQLIELLRQSNLQALPVFERLLRQHGPRLGQPMQLLELDIRELDFPAALARSLTMLASLPP